ncbi:VanW family protein [Mycolicibacterium bacteremicum]|nr:VanW family protein [Mycolicibacterium bacteremicum]
MSDEQSIPPLRATARRRLLTFGLPLAALAVLYVVDLAATASKVPRGVTAAGVPLGGLTAAAAEQRLREAISPRESEPIPVTLGALSATVDPGDIGLAADPAATVAHAGGQPLNPATRIISFFVDTPVELVTSVNQQALTATLDDLGTAVAEEPVEGSIVFVGGEPTPSDPRSGWRLDVPAAAEVFVRDWATGQTVALPMLERPPQTTAADIATALDEIATPAVSGPITVEGADVRGTIAEDVVAAALTFTPEQGRLMPELDETVIVDALRPQLAPSEFPVRNADIDFAATPPVKTPAQDGRRLDYDATLENLLDVLGRADDRRIDAVYVEEKATFGFDELNELGPVEVIGEFQTGGFSGDSGRNIRRAAEQINGAVVGPGEIFSLNAATNPRNAASGYVEAGIIENGRPARGVGGGVSQVATTLFNAAYFAGLEDIEHHEHSYYISRYPAGREATVFGDVLDVKFRNDGPTSVQIQTQWTPSAVTIRVVGIKRYEVTSAQSARSRPTSPQTISIPAGEACSASGGAPGFTITDTRTLRDITTGDTRTQSHTVTYDPIPRVVCGG